MHLSTPTKTLRGLLFLSMVFAFSPVAAQSINTSGMTFELRRAVENFPVTLYTGPSCSPCDAGKALLTARGVPFIEKTIDTQADINALKARNLGDQLPVLSVGSRTVKGYEAGQWEAALNFGSYPKSSQLPRGYSNRPPRLWLLRRCKRQHQLLPQRRVPRLHRAVLRPQQPPLTTAATQRVSGSKSCSLPAGMSTASRFDYRMCWNGWRPTRSMHCACKN